MKTHILVHSMLHHDGTVTHDIQMDNQARAKQARRLLVDNLGYEEARGMHSATDAHGVRFYAFEVWSLEDQVYWQVPVRGHRDVLKALGIPGNKRDVQTPQVITTSHTASHSRSRQRKSPSPERRLSLS
jgi:hypothetical protein